MPKVGEIKKAYEVGYKGHRKYIWILCPICNKGRWICLTNTYKPEHTGKCKSCIVNSFALEGHPQWKGGQYTNSHGYVMVKRYGHPHADSWGYVKRSRLVLEEKLGRPLLDGYDSHHRNEIKDDDRPENLLEILHSEHQSLHGKLRKWNTVFGNKNGGLGGLCSS